MYVDYPTLQACHSELCCRRFGLVELIMPSACHSRQKCSHVGGKDFRRKLISSSPFSGWVLGSLKVRRLQRSAALGMTLRHFLFQHFHVRAAQASPLPSSTQHNPPLRINPKDHQEGLIAYLYLPASMHYIGFNTCMVMLP